MEWKYWEMYTRLTQRVERWDDRPRWDNYGPKWDTRLARCSTNLIAVPLTPTVTSTKPAEPNLKKVNENGPVNLCSGSSSNHEQEQGSQPLDASIQQRIEALVHATQCRKGTCSVPSCRKIKLLAKHSAKCKQKKDGECASCKHLVKLRIYHAKYCQDKSCSLPFCSQLKQTLKSKQELKCTTKIPQQTSRTEISPQKSTATQQSQAAKASNEKLCNLKTIQKKMGNAKLPLGKGKAGKNPELLRQEILLAPRLKRMTGNNNANMVKTSLDQQTGQKPSSQESCIQSAQLNAEEQPASQDEHPSPNSILPSVESQQQPHQVSSLPQADELHQTIAMLQQMKQAIMQQMQQPPQEFLTSLPDDTESISQPPPRTLIDSLLETSPEFFSQKLVSLSKHEHEFLAVLESNPALMAVLEGRKFPFSPRVKKKGRVRSARLYQAKHCRSLHQNLNEMDMHSGMMLGLEAGMLIGLQAKQFSNASMMMTEVLNDSSLVDEDGVSNLVSDMQQVVVPRMQSQLLEQQQGTSSTLCRQLTLQQKHASLFAHEKSEQPSAADSQRLSSPSTNILNGSSDVASQESCFGHESRTSKKRMRKRLWRAKLRKAKLSGAPPLPKF